MKKKLSIAMIVCTSVNIVSMDPANQPPPVPQSGQPFNDHHSSVSDEESVEIEKLIIPGLLDYMSDHNLLANFRTKFDNLQNIIAQYLQTMPELSLDDREKLLNDLESFNADQKKSFMEAFVEAKNAYIPDMHRDHHNEHDDHQSSISDEDSKKIEEMIIPGLLDYMSEHNLLANFRTNFDNLKIIIAQYLQTMPEGSLDDHEKLLNDLKSFDLEQQENFVNAFVEATDEYIAYVLHPDRRDDHHIVVDVDALKRGVEVAQELARNIKNNSIEEKLKRAVQVAESLDAASFPKKGEF